MAFWVAGFTQPCAAPQQSWTAERCARVAESRSVPRCSSAFAQPARHTASHCHVLNPSRLAILLRASAGRSSLCAASASPRYCTNPKDSTNDWPSDVQSEICKDTNGQISRHTALPRCTTWPRSIERIYVYRRYSAPTPVWAVYRKFAAGRALGIAPACCTAVLRRRVAPTESILRLDHTPRFVPVLYRPKARLEDAAAGGSGGSAAGRRRSDGVATYRITPITPHASHTLAPLVRLGWPEGCRGLHHVHPHHHPRLHHPRVPGSFPPPHRLHIHHLRWPPRPPTHRHSHGYLRSPLHRQFVLGLV